MSRSVTEAQAALSESSLARDMAEAVCRGMQAHDTRDREAADEAFEFVDRHQFPFLSRSESRAAAEAYVDALWAKDALEVACTVDGELDTDLLARADWSPVREAFAERAEVVGMDGRYAEASTVGWKRHKVGGDYRRGMGLAQLYELRAALQDPEYPHKPHQGRSGFGPEVARYLLAVELHDMHSEDHWEQALGTMTHYYDRILAAHADVRPA